MEKAGDIAMQIIAELIQKNDVPATKHKSTSNKKFYTNSITKIDHLHNLECDLYDEINELEIPDTKKDSIYNKLNELLNNMEVRA